jgi:hypothetical protein
MRNRFLWVMLGVGVVLGTAPSASLAQGARHCTTPRGATVALRSPQLIVTAKTTNGGDSATTRWWACTTAHPANRVLARTIDDTGGLGMTDQIGQLAASGTRLVYVETSGYVRYEGLRDAVQAVDVAASGPLRAWPIGPAVIGTRVTGLRTDGRAVQWLAGGVPTSRRWPSCTTAFPIGSEPVAGETGDLQVVTRLTPNHTITTYACSPRRPKIVHRLGRIPITPGLPGPTSSVGGFVSDGRWLAYFRRHQESGEFFTPTGTVTTVLVVDLTTDRPPVQLARAMSDGTLSLADLAIADGTVRWTENRQPRSAPLPTPR